MGNHVILISLLHGIQGVSLHSYIIIPYSYVIITQGPIITHYYLFQLPELAAEGAH